MRSDRPRRPRDPIAAAEAAFKVVTTKRPDVVAPKRPSVPNVKELVSLRNSGNLAQRQRQSRSESASLSQRCPAGPRDAFEL